MAAVSLPITSPPSNGLLLTTIAKKHRDGSLLLSVADDRICKLNCVGTLTWMIIEQSETALSVGQIVRELDRQFVAINATGELWYDVQPAQLQHDTECFLKNLAQKRLLLATTDVDRCEFYQINNGVSGTTSVTVASPVECSEDFQPSEPIETTGFCKPSKCETIGAFLGLLAFDLMLRVKGFQAVIERVATRPIRGEHTRNRKVYRRVCATVDRAQMYYPKKVKCLQHSAVVTCLLRRRGVPAEMVLGAQTFPPRAHAWVEVGKEVVNDSADVKFRYREFRRLRTIS